MSPVRWLWRSSSDLSEILCDVFPRPPGVEILLLARALAALRRSCRCLLSSTAQVIKASCQCPEVSLVDKCIILHGSDKGWGSFGD